MTNKEPTPQRTNPETGEPIVHPVGTFETRETAPGEIGYSKSTPEGVAVTALKGKIKDESIGDSDRVTYPAVLSSSTPEAVDATLELERTVTYLKKQLLLSILPMPQGITHNMLGIALQVWGEKFQNQILDDNGPLDEGDAKRLAAIGSEMKNGKLYQTDNFSELRREAQEIVDRIKL